MMTTRVLLSVYNTGIATYIWVITRSKSNERKGKVQLIDASGCYEKRRKPLGNKRVEITEMSRQLIMQAYHDFNDGVLTKASTDGTEIRVESKVRENDYFKYSKLFIMNPEHDAEGNMVHDSKGKPVIDKSLNDTEIIPWLTNRDEYLQENVAPLISSSVSIIIVVRIILRNMNETRWHWTSMAFMYRPYLIIMRIIRVILKV